PAPQTKAPEPRFAYHRRCQQFRKHGEQCKAPALKGGEHCYKHAGMIERAAREARQISELSLPQITTLRAVNLAITKVAQGIIERRIDHRPLWQVIRVLELASKLVAKSGHREIGSSYQLKTAEPMVSGFRSPGHQGSPDRAVFAGWGNHQITGSPDLFNCR